MLTLSTAKMLSFAEGGGGAGGVGNKGISEPMYRKCSKTLGKQCYVKSSNMLA